MAPEIGRIGCMKAWPPPAPHALPRPPVEGEPVARRARTPSSRPVFLIVSALLAGSVAACSPPPSPVAEKQIATLRTIADLETDVSSFAASRPGVRAAEAFIREGGAIVILTPADGERITPGVVEEIDRYIGDRTGLSKDRIVIKARASAGGNSR